MQHSEFFEGDEQDALPDLPVSKSAAGGFRPVGSYVEAVLLRLQNTRLRIVCRRPSLGREDENRRL